LKGHDAHHVLRLLVSGPEAGNAAGGMHDEEGRAHALEQFRNAVGCDLIACIGRGRGSDDPVQDALALAVDLAFWPVVRGCKTRDQTARHGGELAIAIAGRSGGAAITRTIDDVDVEAGVDEVVAPAVLAARSVI